MATKSKDAKLCTRYKQAKKPPRHPEEAFPSLDYVDKLLTLGPRQGERYTTFRRRVGGIAAVRELWFEAWEKTQGDKIAAAKLLRVNPTALGYELSIVGLSPKILYIYLFRKEATLAIKNEQQNKSSSDDNGHNC